MMPSFLTSKIERVADAESNFNPTYQIAALGITSDYIKMDVGKEWFCSISGYTVHQAQGLVQDATKVGYTIVRPKGKDLKIDYNPKVTDAYGNDGGKLFSPSAVSTKYAEILNASNLSPTITSINTVPRFGIVSPNISIQTTSLSTSTNNLTPPIPTAGVVGAPSPISGVIGFSHQIDVDAKGKKTPTRDNGYSPSLNSVRNGTVLIPNSSVANLAKGKKSVQLLIPNLPPELRK